MTQKLLRVWPGIVIVVLLWLSRFGIKAVIPGIDGFSKAMMTSFVFTALLVIWWAFFSRAHWLERLAALALIAVALTGTWFFRHDSMHLAWFLAYVIPVTSLAFVAWAVITRRMSDRVRHATMVATILIACGGWLLLRQDGINGDHQATFGWRWAASPEERMLAQVSNETVAPAPTASVAPTAMPAASPTASVSEEAAKSPATQPVETRAAWPGFRGPKRDGIVHGVKIDTDWSGKPPVQLWRRPVGPGWSSFAVNGDLLYTQEQRGENEVVSCYKASTGQPVWTHQDAARFFESNAGAGPRATPTLSSGRVYTFGATGILNALDANNGAVLWSRNVAKETNTEVPFWGFSGSPLVIGDLVIVAASGQLVAYDAAAGTRRWLGPAGGGSYSSPQFVTIDGVAQVMLVNGAGVTSVAVADGKQLWEHKWSSNFMVQPALIGESDILLTSQENGARRIAVSHNASGWNVAERWTSNGLKPYFNDFVVHKGHAFGFDGRILACIDLANGERKWKGGRYGNGQLLLLADEDVLIVLSEDGELAFVGATPDQYKELARFPALNGKTWNHPALVGDILLVRNGEEMAAFRLATVTRP